MQITLRKNEVLAIEYEDSVIAVVGNPTLAKLRTAIMEHLCLEDAAISSPPEEFNSSDLGHLNLVYQCLDEGEPDTSAYFIDVVIFPLILY